MPCISIDVDLDEFEDRDLLDECRKRGLVGSISAGEHEALVERAFLAVRDIPDLPRDLKDLFYQVHDRAIP